MDSGAGTITLAYDDLNRLTSETTPEGVISYGYDHALRRTSAQVTGQSAATYSYDNANRLTGITQGTASVTYAYDVINRLTSLTYPSGAVASYSYDAASQLSSISYSQGGSSIGNLLYGYDTRGLRRTVAGSLARTGIPAAVASASYNANHQLTAWGGATLSYDNNGNLTGDGTNTYTWNARNQLTAISGGTTASFAYDGFGRRRSRTLGGTATSLLYDGANPVQELQGGSTSATQLTGLGIDQYLTRTEGGTTRTLLTDALGSTVALADSGGTVQTSYTYEPYGRTSTSGTASNNPHQYTGREDDGTGLYYYRARYYSPSLQRFISEDSVGFLAGNPNLYGYTDNNPVMFTDPSGEVVWVPAMLAIGGLVGAGAGAVS